MFPSASTSYSKIAATLFRRDHLVSLRAYVDAHLHGTGEIERKNILEIRVAFQRFDIGRTFLGDAMETAAEGFQFFFDYFPIHARLLSRRILWRYGRKSVLSKMCFRTRPA